jgi:non-ribosomal peptide synthetase component F
LIGFFVNTLVLRSDLSADPSFAELLGRVRETCLGAYAHQDLPFEMLVEELRPQRELSRSSLFQVMFILQNAPLKVPTVAGLTSSPFVELSDNGTSKFDLILILMEGKEGMAATIEYNTDLFEDATIERLLGHYRTLLEAVVAEPGRKLSRLPLLTAAEQEQLAAWNRTDASYPADECIHELFEMQAARTPDAVAVVCGDGSLTYRELNRRANRLANRLRALGVGPEVLVGLYLERSLDLLIGVLGVLKTGGAYVPLDPAYPGLRLAAIVEDAEPRVLLTQRALVADLPANGAHILCLDAEELELGSEVSPSRAAHLAGTPIVCPGLDADLVGRYLAGFVHRGFLPAPRDYFLHCGRSGGADPMKEQGDGPRCGHSSAAAAVMQATHHRLGNDLASLR